MRYRLKTFKWVDGFLRHEILEMEEFEDVASIIRHGDHDEVKVYDEDNCILFGKREFLHMFGDNDDQNQLYA